MSGGAVLDAWALLALLNGEPSAARVQRAIADGVARVSAVNLGEVLYALVRTHGQEIAGARVDALRRLLDCEDPDWPLVRVAATVKAAGGLSYADAFCVATAERHGLPVWTGDPELLGGELGVETVDLRSARPTRAEG